MRKIISATVLTKLALFLLFASPAACQKTLHPSAATVSCKPERALVLGSSSDGQVKKYEHWDAGCRIVVGGQVIFYRDFFLRKPTVNYYEAALLGWHVIDDLTSESKKFPATTVDCRHTRELERSCRITGKPEMIHAVYAEANILYFSQEHNDKTADIDVPQENKIRHLLQQHYDDFNDDWFDGKLPPATVLYFSQNNTPDIGTEQDQSSPAAPHAMIFVNAYYDRDIREADFTLFHEMCHVWADTYGQPELSPHGSAWQGCMLHLALEGAFSNLW